MPTENDKPAAAAATTATVDTITPELKELRAENAQLKKDLEAANKRVDAIEKKLKEKGPAAPAGDHCVLGGKTFQVDRVISAKFAGDEGRKGNLPQGIDTELVVLKR